VNQSVRGSFGCNMPPQQNWSVGFGQWGAKAIPMEPNNTIPDV